MQEAQTYIVGGFKRGLGVGAGMLGTGIVMDYTGLPRHTTMNAAARFGIGTVLAFLAGKMISREVGIDVAAGSQLGIMLDFAKQSNIPLITDALSGYPMTGTRELGLGGYPVRRLRSGVGVDGAVLGDAEAERELGLVS